MKRTKLLTLFIGIGLVLTLLATPLISGCGGGVPGGAETVTLVMANGYPRGHTAGSLIMDAYIDRVVEMSEGKIIIDHQDAGRLLKFKAMMSGIKDGVTDMGIPIASYMAGDVPLISITAMPYLAKDYGGRIEQFWNVVTEQPDIVAELERWNNKPLYAWSVDESFVHSKVPINRVEDFKGLKIRTSGGIGDEVRIARGATPVNIPSPETYVALQRGVADGAVMHVSSFWGWKWYEQAKYTIVQEPSFAAVSGTISINSDKFDSLPKWAQDILLEAGEEHMEWMSVAFPALALELQDKLKAQGNTLIMLPSSEVERMKQMVAPIGPKWAAEHGAAGARVWDFMLKQAD